MSDGRPAAPDALRVGRRALEGITGVQLLEDLHWMPVQGKWALKVRLKIASARKTLVPEATDWYVQVANEYPGGQIGIFPAKVGGITATFQHQIMNQEGVSDVPFRKGKICTHSPLSVSGRRHYDEEPVSAEDRLQWHVRRALMWLLDASNEKLVEKGDYFEVPDFATNSTLTVVHREDDMSLEAWRLQKVAHGEVRVFTPRFSDSYRLVGEFLTGDGASVVKYDWDDKLRDTEKGPESGAWILFKAPIALPPWQAPMTWAELRAVAKVQGLDLDTAVRTCVNNLRDGRAHLLLLGFPVPRLIGEHACAIHWQALLLQALSWGSQTAKGFRTNDQGHWVADLQRTLSDPSKLNWVATENWAPEVLLARGALPISRSRKRLALLGAGALGSFVAELLARGGVRDLIVVDEEDLEAANLVRHTLGIGSLGKAKALELAARLNEASPEVHAMGVRGDFPALDSASLAELGKADVLIDCTGDDDVLRALERLDWDGERTFVSLSIGLGARRLYCLASRGRTFPWSAFQTAIQPWLDKDTKEGGTLPRAGIGCWHPFFPATAGDVAMWASVACKVIGGLDVPSGTSSLRVYEQDTAEAGRFGGCRLVSEEARPSGTTP